MKPSKSDFRMETAGSLVPDLEGLRRSAVHPSRLRQSRSQHTKAKGKPSGDRGGPH